MPRHDDERLDRHDAPNAHPGWSALPSRRSRRWPLGAALPVALLVVALALGATAASLDGATGVTRLAATPDLASAGATPMAGECQVAPRTVASLRRLNLDAARAAEMVVAINTDIDTGLALRLLPFNAFTPVPIPPPSAVDPETFAQVNATYRQLTACTLAGEPLRRAALFSDAFFTDFILLVGPLSERNLNELATPEPLSMEEQDPFFPITADDLRRLPDGRIGVLVPAPAPQPGGAAPPADTRMLVFIEQGDRFLVDDVLFVSPAATPPADGDRLVTPIAAIALATALAATAIVPGETSMLALSDGVELYAEPAADAPVVQTLAAGQLLRVTGSPVEAGGETWWPISNPATDTTGFAQGRRLIVARNEITTRVEATTLVEGTPVPSTPGAAPATTEPVLVVESPEPVATPSTG